MEGLDSARTAGDLDTFGDFVEARWNAEFVHWATLKVGAEKNLEKKFEKLELKFEENNNKFEKKLEQIVQCFTSELNTVVAQINLRFSSLMNTMESTP
ncbi:hypothetical protein TNCV_2363561 [Trichonephila clavipes]|nr:hypothetical protein TNCV_2363561 [Trichonephila clavipes]